MCRKCYVHSAVFEGLPGRDVVASLSGAAAAGPQLAAAELRPDARSVLSYLLERAEAQRQAGSAAAAAPTEGGLRSGRPAVPGRSSGVGP
jgi:hypothetical protein